MAFSSLHCSQMVLRQGAAPRISLINCSLCIHTNNTEGQIMNSCIVSCAKSPEFALEWGQAFLVKCSVGLALLLPGHKCTLMTAKLGNIFPFLSCSQYCPWHPNGPRYIIRGSKTSILVFPCFLSRYSLRHTTYLSLTYDCHVLPQSQHPVDQKMLAIPNCPQLWLDDFDQWHTGYGLFL